MLSFSSFNGLDLTVDRQVICGIYNLIFLGTSLSAKLQTVAEGSAC